MTLKALCIASALLIAPAAASAQTTAPAPATAAKAKPAFTTGESTIGEILDDEAAKAIVDKHVVGFSKSDQIDLGRGLTLKEAAQYSPKELSDEVLAAIDADFAKLPAKK